MTLPKDVQDSLAEIAGEAECRCNIAYTSRGLKDPACNHDLAESVELHLLSQDVENASLRGIIAECASAAGALISPDCSSQFLAGVPAEIRAVCQNAESRLAAADALLGLLRTGKDGKKYACVESRDGTMVEVTTCLQGCGDA